MFHLTTALDAASGVPLYEQLYELSLIHISEPTRRS